MCFYPIRLKRSRAQWDYQSKSLTYYNEVPCGKCLECKKIKAMQNAFRFERHTREYPLAWFVTLTYDDTYVPVSDNGYMTLRKKDVQDFLKRLRKSKPGLKISYYAIGEYGDDTKRPHYHAIIWNVGSEAIRKAWGKGFVTVAPVSGARYMYVAKYMLKPVSEELEKLPLWDGEKEKVLCSNCIGMEYLKNEQTRRMIENLELDHVVMENGIKLPLPNYYKEKVFGRGKVGQKTQSVLMKRRRKSDEEWRELERLTGNATLWLEVQRFRQIALKIKFNDYQNKQKKRDLYRIAS